MASINLNEIAAKFRGLTLDNVGAWPMLPRMTLWGAVVVACAAMGYIALWRDQMDQLDVLRQQESGLKEQYRSKLQQAVNLEELRRQKEQVNQFVLTLEKQLPSKAEMDALLSDINQAGIGRGLQFELFRPGQTNVRDYYAELPISIKVSGRFHDLGAFASDIANLPRIVTLNNINIQTVKDQTLGLEATAKTFRYLDEEEMAAQRKTREAARPGAKK
jgi:type IV pilus assembly protein PilO